MENSDPSRFSMASPSQPNAGWEWLVEAAITPAEEPGFQKLCR
ncbi:MAG: hypothetical protein ACLVD7_10220 [[Clostridium] leptum]